MLALLHGLDQAVEELVVQVVLPGKVLDLWVQQVFASVGAGVRQNTVEKAQASQR